MHDPELSYISQLTELIYKTAKLNIHHMYRIKHTLYKYFRFCNKSFFFSDFDLDEINISELFNQVLMLCSRFSLIRFQLAYWHNIRKSDTVLKFFCKKFILCYLFINVLNRRYISS